MVIISLVDLNSIFIDSSLSKTLYVWVHACVYVCVRACVCVCILGRGKCFMHCRNCVPVCRTVLDAPTKPLTLSSLAFLCPRGTAAKHYFAEAASAVQLFHIFSFRIVCNGEPLLLVSVVVKPLTADHFSSVVNINIRRVSGPGVDPSVSSSSFVSSVKRWHQKNTRSASSGTPHPAGHCGASACLIS